MGVCASPQTLPTTTYELVIVAKDMAGSEVGLPGTATATITITDRNDHAPEFTHSLFQAVVDEGSTAVVVNLTVDDRDDPATGAWRAVYSIINGDPNQSFEITTNPDNNEGMLTVTKPLDYESTVYHTLLIKVENEEQLVPSVGYGPSSTATVHITVQDVNEGPLFYPNPMLVTKQENIAEGSFVAVLNATDPDYLQSQNIRYTLGHNEEWEDKEEEKKEEEKEEEEEEEKEEEERESEPVLIALAALGLPMACEMN
ncbi:hypothetical protein ACEWY4_010411 [Coilia grayii]|uniref:Cadherin domain-containing protein n=1 Tax=Coilia grayii TaxID=363190 RepID=A0ABD1K1T5_9TELE